MEFITCKSLCSICLSRWQRFEPVTAGWEARTLPLCYTAQLQTSNTYHFTSSNVIFLLFRDSSGFSSNVKKNLLLLIFYCFFCSKIKRRLFFSWRPSFRFRPFSAAAPKNIWNWLKWVFLTRVSFPPQFFVAGSDLLLPSPAAFTLQEIYMCTNTLMHTHPYSHVRTHSCSIFSIADTHTHPHALNTHTDSLSLSWAA